MTITLCDRCGRRTVSTPRFLEKIINFPNVFPDDKWRGKLQLCSNCTEDFDRWFKSTENYTPNFVVEKKGAYK